MDTSFYFVRSKGQEKGPYAFYQIQQMRTDEVFTRDKFTPEEWEQLEQFLDDGGDVPLPRPGIPVAVRRAPDASPLQQQERRLTVGLTYLSYAIGGLMVVGALIQGEHDYILQARPMFWLGLFFSMALCHTVVDQWCRRQLLRYAKTSRLDLMVKYVMALLGLGIVIGALVGVSKIPGLGILSAEDIWNTGKKFLIAAAVVSLYRPFYLQFMAEHEYLKPRRQSSVMWLIALLGSVILLVLYLTPNSVSRVELIASVRDNLFTSEEVKIEGDSSDWKFPVHLGDSQKAVQRILGKPTIVGRDYVYHSLHISFDQQYRVARLHFDGRETANSVYAKKQIVAGLTPAGGLKEMKAVFGSKNVTFGDDLSETHVWEVPGYRVAAAFWNKDTREGKANAMRWLEISATQ